MNIINYSLETAILPSFMETLKEGTVEMLRSVGSSCAISRLIVETTFLPRARSNGWQTDGAGHPLRSSLVIYCLLVCLLRRLPVGWWR